MDKILNVTCFILNLLARRINDKALYVVWVFMLLIKAGQDQITSQYFMTDITLIYKAIISILKQLESKQTT